MANDYFEFKQFRIDQDRCAMKVTTDACILGAYAPAKESKRILDIGTGTGLLALMLAQRTQGIIDVIENDESSFLQAKENVLQSPWHDRINVIHCDLRDFDPEKKHDFIICNPPFFENHLRSASIQKNQAKHDLSLDYATLLDSVTRLLDPSGFFTVLLPYNQSQSFVRSAEVRKLHISKQLLIRNRPDKSFIRMVMIFSFLPSIKIETEILSIKNESGEYSDFFHRLLKDFYLHL
jgi:tRNA1Val (adenine37-N6)-methyltransferase